MYDILYNHDNKNTIHESDFTVGMRKLSDLTCRLTALCNSTVQMG